MSNIDLESLVRNLVEGSTWASKKGKVYTVLLVTNVTVKEHLRERLAPHVVFINSEGEVFSLDCDTFLRTYRYVDLDQRMALLMERVYQYTAGEYDPLEQESVESQVDDDLVDDDEPLDFNSIEPETLEPQEEEQTFISQEQVKERTVEQVVPTFAEQLASQYTNVIDFGRISETDSSTTPTFGGLDQQILNRALTGYTLAPNCLVLEFGAQQPINVETLIEAFGPDGYNHAHLMAQGDDVTWNYLSHIEQKYYNGALHFVVVLANYAMPIQNQQCSENCDECESNVECDGREVQEPLLMEPNISVNEAPTPMLHDLVYGDGLGELNPEHDQPTTEEPIVDNTVEPQSEEQPVTQEPSVEEVIEEHFDELVQAEDTKVIAHVVPNAVPTQTVGEPVQVDTVAQTESAEPHKRLMPYDPAFDDFVEVTDLEEQQVVAVTDSVLGK